MSVVAQKTGERFVQRIGRLYEQGADAVRIGQYVRRWCRWVEGGLRGHALDELRGVTALFAWVIVGVAAPDTLQRTRREPPGPPETPFRGR